MHKKVHCRCSTGFKYTSGSSVAPYEMTPLNSFLLQYLRQNHFVFCFQKWKHCTFALKIFFRKNKLLHMHIRQNFHFARIFSPRKKVEVVYTLSPLVTGKKQLNFSFLWYLSRHQNKKKQNKVSNSRNWSSIHFSNIFQWLFEIRSWNKL